jgi:hypothetical protein
MSMMSGVRIVVIGAALVTALTPRDARAQAGHEHHAAAAAGWRLMQDGVVAGIFNEQGGPRGDREFFVPNWWMGMLTRDAGRHRITLSGMFSLDPATVGKSGYAELFQVGEALDGVPLVDRQHPHDFFMQLAAAWRISLGERASLTLSGGPAGEPTLGPVAFMHRASAAGLPFAPLGHHTFDSTHISFGVAAASLAVGRVTVEASVFNGREPDEDRWDINLDRLDSYAGRVWFRPRAGWEFQLSSGRLREPEELEPGDVTRTTASGSWTRVSEDQLVGVTAGWGVNAAHGDRKHGLFVEATSERGKNMLAVRLERQDLEVEKLLGHDHAHGETGEPSGAVTAFTVGVGRRVLAWRGFEGSIAIQGTLHWPPAVLEATHGTFPKSAQVYFRLRLPSPGMPRMWGMTMSKGH